MTDRMTTLEFLREFSQSQTRGQLLMIAAVGAFSVLSAVAVGMAGFSGWLALAGASGTLIAEWAVLWWALGIERVQRWIMDGL